MKQTASAPNRAPRAIVPRIRKTNTYPITTGNLAIYASNNATIAGTNRDSHTLKDTVREGAEKWAFIETII
jgi:hypothetical protein